MKKAILLMNVGTPDSPEVKDVRRYLSQFLNDPRVITIPWLWRKLLVNLIIIPFRAGKSAALYRLLWTENGSPLRYYLLRLRDDLQALCGRQADVWAAMSYGYPHISTVMEEIRNHGYTELVVVPLFPQYASSTNGSATDAVIRCLSEWPTAPKLKFVAPFYNHPAFIEAWAARIAPYKPLDFDHIIFSFHGLPLSHIPKICRTYPDLCDCSVTPGNTPCYRSTCYIMAEKLAARLNFQDGQYSVSFQSRMSKRWLQPFTDQVLVDLAQKGTSGVLVIPLSFVADCLETSVELGIEYKNIFLQHGGKKYVLVESLNDLPEWVNCLGLELLQHMENRPCY